MRITALMAGPLLLFSIQPLGALTIRGDALWRSNRTCPEAWSAPAADDSAWLGVEYPWYHHWPLKWDADPAARFFWGQQPSSGVNEQHTCVRRHFYLDAVPSGPAIAHIRVDDDYDFYLNGSLIRASDGTQPPADAHDVSPWLRTGDNVIAMKLIDRGGSMGALFSLTVPGTPDPPRTWGDLEPLVVPWLQFVAIVLLLALIGIAVARLRIPVARRLGRHSPATMALLIALIATGCELLLVTQVFWRSMSEKFSYALGASAYPLAHWNYAALAAAASLFLVLVVLCGAWNVPAEPPPAPRVERVVLAAILLLALILRTYHVDSIPVGFIDDDAFNANEAFDLIQFYPETGARLWSDTCEGRPTLYLYLVGVCAHLLGSTYLSLKIVPVAVGVATVATLYGLGRVAFGRREALWAAFFLAVSRWHLHYSRITWEAICMPLFSTAGFALLLHGLRRERRGIFSLVAGALVLSVGLYTYAAYRAIPVVAIIFIFATFVSSDRDIISRRDKVVGLVVGAGLAVVLVLPLALFAWREPSRYWQRYNNVSLINYMTYFGTPMPWVHMLGKGLLSFNAQGDELIRNNLPFAPHLDVLTGTLFLVGAATTVWTRGSVGMRLLWVWFLTLLGLAALTREMPHAIRLLGLAPVAALLAAVGTTQLLAARRSARRGVIVRGVVVSLALATIGINSYQYFVVEANHSTADSALNLTGRTLCEYMRQQDGVDVYWTPDIALWAGDQCHFLARGRYTPAELTIERARNPTAMHRERSVIAFIGPEFLDDHRTEIGRAADGRPLLNFPVEPVVQRGRRGELLYYMYRF